jgi:hypothetical protein
MTFVPDANEPDTAPRNVTLLRPAAVRSLAANIAGVGPGTRLLNDRFELEERLGRGGMAVVFRALDLEAQRLKDPSPRLALKVLADAIHWLPQARLALQRELSRARRLTHPNIVRVFEFYEDRGICFITMELLEGRAWDRLIDAYPRGMPLAEARPLIEQLCAALSYAHGQGVVHSDLKPQNLFLTRQQQVKVLDFGIAATVRGPASDGKVHDTLYNPRQLLLMSQRYACPEMWQGQDADPRDDVYSAACIIYELLSGWHPFGPMDAKEACQRGMISPPIKSLSKVQNRALHHALELKREQRTASIEEFTRELWAPAPVVWQRRKWSLLGGGAVAVGVLAGSVILTSHGLHPAPQGAPPDTLPGQTAQSLVSLLGMTDASFEAGAGYTREEVLAAVARSPRRAELGSSPEQMAAGMALCQETSKACTTGTYADEISRRVVLGPFRIDPTAVTVSAFREFVTSTGYRTQPERSGGAYVFSDGQLRLTAGGTWRNAAGTGKPSEHSAVVGVSFADAQAYCVWRGSRLPTEDEWEYSARGPRASIFPWGDDPAPARARVTERPAAADGPREGADGSLRGMSGNVWEWVDTQGAKGPGQKVLKGGSWLELGAANKRAAGRRSELATRADSDSGFRCARSEREWPDAQFWIGRLP